MEVIIIDFFIILPTCYLFYFFIFNIIIIKLKGIYPWGMLADLFGTSSPFI